MSSATRDSSPSVRYYRSSFCLDGNCVEVAAIADDRIAVRDSKDADSTALVFTGSEWDAFVEGIKAGELSREALGRLAPE